VVIGMILERASDRIERLRAGDPLLAKWVADGSLAAGEADLLVVLDEASRLRRPQRFSLPGRSSSVAAAAGVHAAMRLTLEPGRYPDGPVALVSGTGPREVAAAFRVGDDPIAAAFGSARLRSDGLVQPLGRSRAVPLDVGTRILFVSSRSRWPSTHGRVGVAIVDRASLGGSFDEAFAWALDAAETVHVIAPLDAGTHPASIEVDWPLIATGADRWGATGSWPVAEPVTLHSVGRCPGDLDDVNHRLARAAQVHRDWPSPVAAAASLTRALAGLAVPVGLYDAHTQGTIAQAFAERTSYLEETRTSHLPVEWSGFAETDWAIVKQTILATVAALEDHNPKATEVGLVVESLLDAGRPVDLWVGSAVHAQALTTHLLTAGFTISPDHIDTGALGVRRLGDGIDLTPTDRLAVLTGSPAPWHLSAVMARGLGPLHVVGYDFECTQVPRRLTWALNATRRERTVERERTYDECLGSGLVAAPEPPPVKPEFSCVHRAENSYRSIELGEDAAEFAALADDQWLALATKERSTLTSSVEQRDAVAFLIDPGPQVLLLAAHGVVDRYVAHRLRPTPVAAVEPGMRLLVVGGIGGVFGAIRPLLDRLNGVGTRYWLEVWEAALRAALEATGSASALTSALRDRGSTISASAVASWPNPYRIGPRDPANVQRVADVAGHDLARTQHRRIHAVMRGVRIEHVRFGRLLAQALRRAADGQRDAFESFEQHFGFDIEDVVDAPTIVTVTERLAAGTAPSSAVGRVHDAAAAQALLIPQEP
jgi:hypothetical protein